MKSYALLLVPCIFSSLLSTSLFGQERVVGDLQNSVLLHRQPAAAGSKVTPVAPVKSFPSFAPRADRLEGTGADGKPEDAKFAGPAITVTSSLAVVLGLFAGLVWLTRKFGSRAMIQGAVPREVLQCLGSTALDSRTRITMVRCGHRVLVMAQTATSIHPLTEVTDPDEVRELTAACLGNSKQTFDSTLQSLEREKTDEGFVGSQAEPPTPRSRGRLFATA